MVGEQAGSPRVTPPATTALSSDVMMPRPSAITKVTRTRHEGPRRSDDLIFHDSYWHVHQLSLQPGQTGRNAVNLTTRHQRGRRGGVPWAARRAFTEGPNL